jgi:hypothetical protein
MTQQKPNRHERRQAARLQRGEVILIHYGQLLERDQNYGLPVLCYVCGAPHKASGLARIEQKRSTVDVPLCEICVASDSNGEIIRKYTKARDLKISEGGELTTEQLAAMVDKQDTTEH